jgi:hypothetical protein
LFEIKKEADEFIKNIDFKEKNIMKFIENIINKAINEINKNYNVFILDGYSFSYDEENRIKNIKNLVEKNKKNIC